MQLKELEPGDLFKCPWRGPTQPVNKLAYKTISAAWVETEEERIIELKDKKTGLTKEIKIKAKIREPWSLGTEVTKTL